MFYALWRRAVRERNQHANDARTLRHALDICDARYQSLADVADILQTRLDEVTAERDAPCPMCEEFERERDNALLELDEVRAALAWLERDFKTT